MRALLEGVISFSFGEGVRACMRFLCICICYPRLPFLTFVQVVVDVRSVLWTLAILAGFNFKAFRICFLLFSAFLFENCIVSLSLEMCRTCVYLVCVCVRDGVTLYYLLSLVVVRACFRGPWDGMDYL